jgi:hypothetical protein
MRRKTLAVLIVLTVGCTAGLLAGAGPSKPHTAQWEYAVYRAWGPWHQWQTPDADISIRGLPEFLRELGLKDVKNERTAEMELANHFGKQGWELIEISAPGQDRAMWSFWFKRPKP